MPAITIATKAGDDGTITIPKEAVEALGMHPGEETEISIDAGNGVRTAPSINYEAVLDKLFQETDSLVPQPGLPYSDSLKAAWGAAVEKKFNNDRTTHRSNARRG